MPLLAHPEAEGRAGLGEVECVAAVLQRYLVAARFHGRQLPGVPGFPKELHHRAATAGLPPDGRETPVHRSVGREDAVGGAWMVSATVTRRPLTVLRGVHVTGLSGFARYIEYDMNACSG